MGVWALQNVTKAVALTGSTIADAVVGVHKAYGNISTLAFRVDDETGSIVIDTEDEIYLTDDGIKVFAGICRQVAQTDQGVTTQRAYQVAAQDFNSRLDDDVIDVGLRTTSESDKARIAWLFATFGTHGINAGTASVVQLRATMPAEQDFSGMTLHEALTEIAKYTGGSFYVDFDKVLHYYDSETIAAPFALSDTPNGTTSFEYEDFTLPRDSIDRCNAVYVIGDAISGWRYLGGVPPAAGTRRAVTIRDPEITTTAQLEAAGDSYLAQHDSDRQLGSLVTYKAGLRAGMTVQITNAGWGYVATSFRISSVTFNPETKDRVRYTINFGARPVTLMEHFAKTIGAVNVLAQNVQDVNTIVADLSAGGGNLVPNSSFEDGSAWSVGAQWVIGLDPVSPQEPFAGSKVARVSLAAQAAGNLVSAYIPVSRLDDYWFSAWRFVRSRSAGTARLYLEEVSAADVVLATHVFDTGAADIEWTRVSLHFANVAGSAVTAWQAGTVKVRIGANSAGAAATLVLDVDGVQLERGKIITAYAPAPYELVDGSITGPKMADLAVTLAKLADGAVSTAKLVDGAVAEAKIATSAITETKIATDAVTSPKIIAGAVVADKIAADAVIAAKIAAGAVSTAKLDALAVTADKVAAGAITAVKIAASAVESDKIAANAIVAGKIAAGVITGTEIGAATLTAGNLSGTGRNLLSNPSFERTDGWGSSRSQEVPRSGAWNGKIPDAGTSLTSETFDVVGLHRYYVSIWGRGNSGNTNNGEMNLRLRWWDINNVQIGTDVEVDGAVYGQNNAYRQFRGFVVAPATAVRAHVFAFHQGAGAAKESYWDDAEFYDAAEDLSHASGNVVIDSTGIAVTNGKITVTNAGATVIIDGTSNMFKIAASGTTSIVVAANSVQSTTVTLTALGSSNTVTPAYLAWLSTTSAGNANPRSIGSAFDGTGIGYYSAASSGGAVTQRMVGAFAEARDSVGIIAGQVFYRLTGYNATATEPSFYSRYYVLKEAAL